MIKGCKYVLMVAPFFWIYFRVDIEQTLSDLANIAWWTVPFVIFSTVAVLFLQSFRWWVLLRIYVPDLKLLKVWSSHLRAGFYAMVIPSSLAQDAVRAVLLSHNIDYSLSWGSTWIYKISGLLGWLALSLIGIFLFETDALPSYIQQLILLSLLGLLFLSILSFSKSVTRPLRELIEKAHSSKILQKIKNVRQAVYAYRDKKYHLLYSIIIAILVQLVMVVGTAVAIFGISHELFIEECIIFIPLIELMIVVFPLTPGGVGIREALIVLMFEQLGLSIEQMSVYVALGVIAYAVRLLGGIPVLVETVQRYRTSSTD